LLKNTNNLRQKALQDKKIIESQVRGPLSGGRLRSPKAPSNLQAVTRTVKKFEDLLGKAPDQKIKPATEVAFGLGAAGGAYVAERADPDNVLSRLASELLLGTGASVTTGLVENVSGERGRIYEIFKLIKDKFSKEGRQKQAMRQILDTLDASDNPLDSVEFILEQLKNPLVRNSIDNLSSKNVPGTVGLQTGSPILLAYEQQLDNLYGADLVAGRDDAAKTLIKEYKNAILALGRSGDQEALQLQAKLVEDVFVGGLANRLEAAKNKMLKAFEAVRPADPETGKPLGNDELSLKLRDLILTQLGYARAQERKIWESIKTVELPSSDFRDGNQEMPAFTNIEKIFWDEKTPASFVKKYEKGPLGPLYKFAKAKRKDLSPEATLANRDVKKLSENLEQINQFFDLNYTVNRGQTPRTNIASFPNDASIEKKLFEMGARQEKRKAADFIEDILSGKIEGIRFPNADYDMATASIVLRPTQREKLKRELGKIVVAGDNFALENKIFQYGEKPDPTTETLRSQDLVLARSEALQAVRELNFQGKDNEARMASNFAEALLEDLGGAPNKIDEATGETIEVSGIFGDDVSQSYQLAKSYSRALNDVFTRSFAGEVRGTTKTGDEKIAPELLAKKISVGGSEPSYIRLKEVKAVADYGKNNNLPGFEETSAGLTDTLEKIVRNARAETFDPDTGEVSEKSLRKWISQNQNILQMFPNLELDLMDVQKAKVLFDNTRVLNSNIINDIEGQVTFKNLLRDKTEFPSSAVSLALSKSQKKPMQSLNNLLLATDFAKTPEEKTKALSGLKHAILEHAFSASGDAKYPSKILKILFEPIPGTSGKQFLLQPKKQKDGSLGIGGWMVENEVMPEQEAKKLREYLGEMMKFEAGLEVGKIEELAETAGPILDMYLAIVGSSLAQASKRALGFGSGPGDIVVAGKGAQAMRTLFDKLPAQARIDVMTEMFKNPKLFETMMQKVKNDREKQNLLPMVGSVLSNVLGFKLPERLIRLTRSDPRGAIDPPVTEEESEETISAPVPVQQAVPNVPVPQVAPDIRQGPDIEGNVEVLQRQTPETTTPINRADYAKMFPGDVVSDLIPEKMAQGGMVPSASIMADTSFTYNPMDTQTNGIRQALNPLGSYIQQSIAESSGINNIQPTLNEIADLVQQKFPTLENAPPMSNTGKITTSSPPLDGIGGLLEQLRAGSRGRPVPTRMPAPPLEMQNLQLAIQDSLNNLQEEEGPPLNRRLISFSGSQQGLTPMSQKPIPEQEPLLDEAQLKPTYGTIQNNTDKIVPQQLVILGEEPQKTGIQTLM
jgi:hypothetical protein